MSEFNFPTKLIRLTKATLYYCDVLHQNDCSESFETRQGFREEDVLSGSYRATSKPIQTTGTIYNKETQLLAYADDMDIVGRSQSTHLKEKQPK
jgi:hypothetical protein